MPKSSNSLRHSDKAGDEPASRAVARGMAADGSGAGARARTGGAAAEPAGFRERARRARAIAQRYRGEAASVLIEIAADFDARAALLEGEAD